jgi:hypothetical protein
MNGPLILILGKDASNYEVAYKHPNATYNENRLPAELVDVHDRWNSCKKHDDSDNARGKERGRVR